MPAPVTIGDVIVAQTAAAAAQAAAAAAAAVADSALATSAAALSLANQVLAADLLAEGAPVFTIDTTVSPPVVTVYITDTSPAGFHSFQPLPDSTPLPVAPPLSKG